MGSGCRLLDLSRYLNDEFAFSILYFIIIIMNLEFKFGIFVSRSGFHHSLPFAKPNRPTDEHWIYYYMHRLYKLWFDPFLKILMSLWCWFHFCMSVWFNSNFDTLAFFPLSRFIPNIQYLSQHLSLLLAICNSVNTFKSPFCDCEFEIKFTFIRKYYLIFIILV